jgi:ANTAR domain/GAF domain
MASRVTEILADVWASSPDGHQLTSALVSICASTLPVSGVGMALMTDSGPAGTVAASDGAALQLEELQFTLGEGPCVDASQTGRPVLEPNLEQTARRRWPAFAAGALGVGVRAIFAFPLRVGAIRVGVLDLYRDSVGTLSAADSAEALAFADAATMLILYLQARQTPDGLPLDSVPVLDDRAEVHQATGVLAVQAGVTLGEAFVLLRARAYAEQRPVGDLARDVLSGVVDLRRDEERN